MKTKDHNEIRYIRIMLPHLLHIRSKELGIVQEQRREWRKLANELKTYLKDRYRTAPLADLKQDISFSKKKRYFRPEDTPVPVSEDSIRLNHAVIGEVRKADSVLKKWLFRTRLRLLKSAHSEENLLHIKLSELNVFNYQKMPFVTSEGVVFCCIYVPLAKTAVEVLSHPYKNKVPKTIMERFRKLSEAGCKVIYIYRSQVQSDREIAVLVRELMESYKK